MDGKRLRELCEWKGIKIIEAELCPNHIHMLIEITPKFSVSGVVGFLKGKSSLLIHERHGNLAQVWEPQFLCRGYYVDTTGKSTQRIATYIQNQLKEDQISDQMTMKEYENPLTGRK